jgi:pyruvate formate lyase activating enzyme
MTSWILEQLGPDVPLHFTAFHPDWKMIDKASTPPQTLTRSSDIALKKGLHYIYTGNVHDFKGSSTYCHNCGDTRIGRDWYELPTWNMAVENDLGDCGNCGTPVAGVFEELPGHWGARRLPIQFAADKKPA